MPTTKPTRGLLSQEMIRRATTRLTSARKEAEQAAEFDLARRQAANTILKPDEVSGDYDAGRVLQTSLRGALRPITLDDLRAFQRNVANLKKRHQVKDRGKPARFIGGITAQQVIDLALDVDKRKANTEIRVSVPVSMRGDVFHFVTNAGPDSDAARHHVHVEFLDFESAVGASSLNAKKTGKAIAKGRLKFNCDCGRHTFWYRYMATIGEYAYGRAETGFPKIRNPKLHGVACKHVLRTMHNILRDANIHRKLYDQVVKARAVLDRQQLKVERVKAADVRAHAEAQTAKSTQSTNLRRSSAATLAAQKAKAKARDTMAKKAAEKLPKAPTPAQVARDKRKAVAGLQSLLSLGAITQAQYETMLANVGSK